MENAERGETALNCDADVAAGARRVATMMGDYLNSLSDVERDRMLQRHLAQVMTVEQKARLVSGMMNFVIAQNQRRMNEDGRGE